jgi:hypothetical protein
MKYAFETLVNVSFSHSYFSDRLFGGFTVEPSQLTLKELLNNGLLFKPYNGGFRILFDSNFAGSLRDREKALNSAIDCQFILKLNDTEFYSYTELEGEDISKSMYYFSNVSADNELSGSLHIDEYVSPKDLRPLESFEEKYFVRPFARLDLRLSSGLEAAYSITFKAKETYWRYILINEAFQSLNSPAIIDSKGSLYFEGPEKLPVQGKEVIAFKSKAPISFKFDQEVFQLVDNYEPESGRYKSVMRALPSANHNYITLLEPNNNTEQINYSEILIH